MGSIGIPNKILASLFWENLLRQSSQIFDIVFTSRDMVTSIQLSTNFNSSVCICESRHNIKTLAASSYSVPLTKTKLEVNPPKAVGDTF